MPWSPVGFLVLAELGLPYGRTVQISGPLSQRHAELCERGTESPNTRTGPEMGHRTTTLLLESLGITVMSPRDPRRDPIFLRALVRSCPCVETPFSRMSRLGLDSSTPFLSHDRHGSRSLPVLGFDAISAFSRSSGPAYSMWPGRILTFVKEFRSDLCQI